MLKKLVHRLVPAPLLRPILAWRSRRLTPDYGTAGPREIFTSIFNSNHWGSGQSVSGKGSEMAATANIRAALPRILKEYKIHSMLDAPCGDFNWMGSVDLTGIEYIGGDIVKQLVARVAAANAAPGRRFMEMDLVNDSLPKTDLILCRDCFNHLPFEAIQKALVNFKRSGARYVLATTYGGVRLNHDTTMGGARAFDLCAWPLNLPAPLERIEEEQPAEAGGYYKCIGLWETASL